VQVAADGLELGYKDKEPATPLLLFLLKPKD